MAAEADAHGYALGLALAQTLAPFRHDPTEQVENRGAVAAVAAVVVAVAVVDNIDGPR